MPLRQAHLRRARHWIANRGFSGFMHEIFWRARLRLRGEEIPGRPGPERGPHPFDLAYGVDTTGLVWGESLAAVHPKQEDAKYWATGYYGVSPSSLDDAFHSLGLDWPEYSFVDIGCGKGRAMLLALRYGFREVSGVELSPELAAVAQRNLAAFDAPWRHRGTPAHVFTGDATTLPLPTGPVLLYLYHPFAAPVMQRFLEHVGESLRRDPRPLYLLYTNPELARMLERTPFLTKLWDRHFPMSNEDAAADRFGSYYERIIAYQAKLTTQ